jgi:hypothetical protein
MKRSKMRIEELVGQSFETVRGRVTVKKIVNRSWSGARIYYTIDGKINRGKGPRMGELTIFTMQSKAFENLISGAEL